MAGAGDERWKPGDFPDSGVGASSGEAGPTPPGDAATSSPSKPRPVPRLLLGGGMVVVLIIVAAVVGPCVRADSDEGSTGIRLDRLDADVTPRQVGDVPVFVVRSGGTYRVFIADARHLPGDVLWWCPVQRVFAGPAHGEIFDEHGRLLAGPARGSLHELPARIEGGGLVVELDDLIDGDERPRADARPSFDRGVDWNLAWDSGPGSFCRDAVHH